MSQLFDLHLQELEDLKTPRKRAIIREAECIGCTKCIAACPVDAILGGAKQMHTVIQFECTGCELCVAPCPVDCIDIELLPNDENVEMRQQKLFQYKKRYAAHTHRLENEKNTETKKAKRKRESSSLDKNAYIAAAMARVNAKKLKI